MTDKQFVDGLIIKPPHEKAPDFVKCSISIKRKDLGNWLRQKDDEWINLDVKVSQNGKWYAEVNSWKPNKKDQPRGDEPGMSGAGSNNFFDDDIPF